MTPDEIKQLDELHAKTTQGEWDASHPRRSGSEHVYCDGEMIADCCKEPPRTECESNAVYIAAIHNAWPAISAELKRLRDFEAAVRDAMKILDHPRVKTEEIKKAIVELDRKRGEHDAT